MAVTQIFPMDNWSTSMPISSVSQSSLQFDVIWDVEEEQMRDICIQCQNTK